MRQPDDPGLRPPKDYSEPDIDPLDPPDPFDPDPMKRVRESPLIRAYIIIIVSVIIATVVFWD